eukprot:s768_g17.t1
MNSCSRYNNKRIAELNAEKDDPVYTARASRLDGWKQLVQQAQAELKVPIAPPERLTPGNVVVFHTPRRKDSYLDIGMVLSVWKGIKQPRLYSGETPINSCTAFRVLSLELADQDQATPREWVVRDRSIAWVVRLESMVTILDVEKCAWTRH